MTYRLRNIGIAIVLAVVAALLTTFYVTNYKRNVQHGESKVPVYVASHDIALGTQGSDIAQGACSRSSRFRVEASCPVRSPARPDRQAGRRRDDLRRRADLDPPLPLRAGAGGQAQLKGNVRAIEVPGSATQLLNGTLQDSDRVDVVGNFLKPETSQNHVSRVVLRNILVLEAPETNSVESHLSSNPNQGFTVMLAMTDSQATKFWWLVSNGEWTLQLRPITDPSDSPEEIQNSRTVALDGLNARQRAPQEADNDRRDPDT
jgi:Flp pilus assembly protein CpaB